MSKYKRLILKSTAFYLTLIICISNYSLASTTDSIALIQSVKNAKNDSAKVLALGDLARYYAPFNNTLAIDNYNLAIKICERNGKGQILEYYEKEMASLKASLGVTYYMIADYPKAIKAELDAISHFKKYDITEKLGRCYIVIGAIYSHQDQVKKALAYQFKSLNISRSLNDSNGIALALNNIGISYFDLDSSKKAIEYYLEAYNIYKKTGDKRGMGVELLNLGSAFKKLNDIDKATAYFKQSVDLRVELNDVQGLIFSHARLGLSLLEKGDLENALANGKKSLAYAQKKNYQRGIRDANELLAKVYEQLGDFKRAFEYAKAYHTAKDSMNDAESISRVARSETEFKFKQKALADSIETAAREKAMNIELQLQETQTEKQSQRANFMAVGIALILVAIVLITIQNRKTTNKNKIIAQQKLTVENAFETLKIRDEEKELLLKEIHHRVKNNLQVISSLLELQAKKVSDSESEVFKEGQSRVRAMALIHEELYQNDELGEVDIKAYTAKLSRQIQSLFPDKEKVRIMIDGPEIRLDIDTSIPLGLIINELVTNAFKYGFEKNGTLLIEFFEIEKGNYQVAVCDSGTGLPDGFELKKAKSLGLRLVNRLSKQLYGSFKHTKEEYSTFTVNFLDTNQRKKVA